MAKHKTVVTPVLTHWSYHSLAQSHQYNHIAIINTYAILLIFIHIGKINIYMYIMKVVGIY